MAKIPFNIKYRPQIESGKYKVVTEDDEPARIICWDSTIDKERPIIAIVYDCQIEQYKADGRYDYEYDTSNYDLFIITPEPELSEFEKELESFYNHHLQVCTYDNQGTVEDSLHYWAAELLALARKELFANDSVLKEYAQVSREQGKAEALKEFEEKYKQSWFNEGKIAGRFEGLTEDKKYQQGVHDGKEKALKDLPMWKPAAAAYDGDRLPRIDWFLNRLVAKFEEGIFYLNIADLYKLPGLKED